MLPVGTLGPGSTYTYSRGPSFWYWWLVRFDWSEAMRTTYFRVQLAQSNDLPE
jgi:hypothetical protein